MRTLSKQELASTCGAMAYAREYYSRRESYPDDRLLIVRCLDAIIAIPCFVITGMFDCGGSTHRSE